MSLLLKKHNDQNIRWKPFATSTPLKPILVNPEDKNRTGLVRSTVSVPDVSQKELDISKILQNKQSWKSKTKITGKSRSIAHFDLSSSSDEDNDHDKGDKIRPLIKIGMDSTNKVKLVPNGKCNVESKATKNRSKIKKKLTSAKLQDKGETQQGFENKAENRSAILENVDVGSNNQAVLPIGFSNHSQENHKPFCVTSKYLQNSKKEKSITNIIVKKPILAVSNESHKFVKSTKKLLKRKDRENRDVHVKKRRDCETENQKMQKLPDRASNSGHQLFTDSTQEELIKSLCLTMPEGDEFTTKADSLNISQKLIMKVRKNKRVKPAISKEDKVVEKIEMSENQDRPKRTRQAPKKYWVIEEKSKPLKEKANGTKIPRKKFTTKCEPTFPVSSELLSLAYDIEGSQAVPENEEVKRPDTMSRKKGQCGAKKNKVSKTSTKTETSSDQLQTTECPVFLPLSDVSYIENEFGHQVSQVCSMKNFKCGIFKLKPGSNYTWKKLQRSNFMGGTLVKGEMRMSIGGQECILHEGDMALVPPLSECQATNIGEHESIFYYWCGRFSK